MWMKSRFACAVGRLLIACAVCSARRTAAPAIPAQQIAPARNAFSSPEMDALAGKLAEKLIKDKVKSVVLVGGAGSDKKVTTLE
jgi:hypothetical protein